MLIASIVLAVVAAAAWWQIARRYVPMNARIVLAGAVAVGVSLQQVLTHDPRTLRFRFFLVWLLLSTGTLLFRIGQMRSRTR